MSRASSLLHWNERCPWVPREEQSPELAQGFYVGGDKHLVTVLTALRSLSPPFPRPIPASLSPW